MTDGKSKDEPQVTEFDSVEVGIQVTGSLRRSINGVEIVEDGFCLHIEIPTEVMQLAVPTSIQEGLRCKLHAEEGLLDVFLRRLAYQAKKLTDPTFHEEPPEYPK